MNNDNDVIILTINGGSNNVIVDLNKEQKFLNQFSLGDQKMSKEMFIDAIKNLDVKVEGDNVEEYHIENSYKFEA